MSGFHTHYNNLRVSRNAPPEVIRAAYRTLAQKYHPDKNPGDPEAARIMALLNASYEVLMDPEKRKRHDEWIKAQQRGFDDPSASTGSETRFHASTPKPDVYVQHSLFWLVKSHPFISTLLMVFGFSMLFKSLIGDAANEDGKASIQPGSLAEDVEIVSPAQPSSFSVAGETGASTDESFRPPTLSQWKKLNGRMSAQQVEKLLGSPKSIKPDGDTQVFFYSANSYAGPYVSIKNGHIYVWGGSLPAWPDTKNTKTPVVGRMGTENCRSSGHQMLPEESFNGYMPGKSRTHTEGLSTFTVDNTQIAEDVLVKLVEVGDSNAARTFQVKGSSRFTVKDLSPGRYKLMYRHRDSCKSSMASDTFVLEEEQVDDGIRYSTVRVTLYKVQNGNLRMDDVEPSEFDKY